MDLWDGCCNGLILLNGLPATYFLCCQKQVGQQDKLQGFGKSFLLVLLSDSYDLILQ